MAFTVADYILQRLSEQHVERLFGVPAAYCAPLFDAAPSHGVTARGHGERSRSRVRR